MNTDVLRRYGLIGGVVFVMILFVIIFGRLLLPAGSDHSTQLDEKTTQRSSRERTQLQEGPLPFQVQRWTKGDPKPEGNRNLESYYELRPYPGGPPKVPHPVSEQFRKDGTKQCKSCHADGGYVPKYRAYAPTTPHPQLSACQQCHVPSRTQETFRKSNWTSVRPPRLGRSELPGSPPPIPHDLLFRRNCNDCHAGPAAPKAIKTDHPNRADCQQCHVAQTTRSTWSRSEND